MDQTLDQIILEDAIGKYCEVQKRIEEIYVPKFEEFRDAAEALDSAENSGHQLWDNQGNLIYKGFPNQERVEAYIALLKQYDRADENLFNLAEMEARGKRVLKELVPRFPGFGVQKPFLLFYTSSDCKPCTYVKETVAKLSKFLPVPFYYTENRKLMNKQGIAARPTIWLYTDDALVGLIASQPKSSGDLWEFMNKAVELGFVYHGEGWLTKAGPKYIISDNVGWLIQK